MTGNVRATEIARNPGTNREMFKRYISRFVPRFPSQLEERWNTRKYIWQMYEIKFFNLSGPSDTSIKFVDSVNQLTIKFVNSVNQLMK